MTAFLFLGRELTGVLVAVVGIFNRLSYLDLLTLLIWGKLVCVFGPLLFSIVL